MDRDRDRGLVTIVYKVIVVLVSISSLVFVLSGCGEIFKSLTPSAEQKVEDIIFSFDLARPYTLDRVEEIRRMGSKVVPVLLRLLTEYSSTNTPKHDKTARWTAIYGLNGLAERGWFDISSIIPGLDDPELSIRVLTAATIIGISISRGQGEAGETIDRALSILEDAQNVEEPFLFSHPPQLVKDFAKRVLDGFREEIPKASSSFASSDFREHENLPLQSSFSVPQRTIAIEVGDTITIGIPIEFRGPGVSQRLIDRWKFWIEDFWNGPSGARSLGDKRVKFEVFARFRAIGSAATEGYHQIFVRDDPFWRESRSNVSFPSTCDKEDPDPRRVQIIQAFSCSADDENPNQLWSNRASRLVVAHEVGHLLGLGDEYTNEGRWGWTNLNPQNIGPQSIMARVWGKVDALPEHISLIIERARETRTNQPPKVTIFVPPSGSAFIQGALITFQGKATDPEDGPLTGSSLVWTSSIDGQIGVGESFTKSDLSVGTHTITLIAADSQGLTERATATIKIEKAVVSRPGCTVTLRPGQSIQAAIDRARSGAVICLTAGTWEENINTWKSLTLRGEGPERSVIEAKDKRRTVIDIGASEVILEGVKVMGAYEEEERGGGGVRLWGAPGIIITAARVTIKNCIISDNLYEGIWLTHPNPTQGSTQATIKDCIISGNGAGIGLSDSAQATIEGCEIFRNKSSGIVLSGDARARILNNIIRDNTFGIGAEFATSLDNVIECRGNTIINNTHSNFFPPELANICR